MAKTRNGRASMFRGKAHGLRVQGLLTKAGGVEFERARKDLERIYVEVTGQTHSTRTGEKIRASDADVIEFLARGEVNTRRYFES
jgi:hypothetical protein